MQINPTIFKAYDIRGIYPTEINEEAAKSIALAYLKILQAKFKKPLNSLKVAVARDNRQASGPLTKAVIEVLLQSGVNVGDLGLISVNDYYFAVGHYQYDGGIMATASHNPPEYGGFKMVVLNQETRNSFFFISGLELQQALKNISLPAAAGQQPGILAKKEVLAGHLKHILKFIDLHKIKPLKVAVDTGGGMAGLMMPLLFKELPCTLIPLFFKPDSNFSNRPPNPLLPGAADKISAKVLAEQADLGIIFDVDGDRIFLIDELGNFIRGDMTLLLLAKALLVKNSGAGVVYNLICSHAVKDLVTKWGGRAIRSEVGYMNLARHMHEEHGLMSGEVSGHYAFKDSFYSDNAFIALVLALQTISEDGRPLSEIIKDYGLYAKGDEINLTVQNIPAKLEKIRKYYAANILDEMDGITVEFADWWFNVRASNTEPLLRITVEAGNKEELKKWQDEVLKVINS
ncbi:MAG: phosphomannomutase/phosphoglucomutase [Candidatus Komeilibacteria bacterium]|nr:phosphomannomutase/phosphoglucomutase [Candidatus Komeilibacteria bacterium]